MTASCSWTSQRVVSEDRPSVWVSRSSSRSTLQARVLRHSVFQPGHVTTSCSTSARADDTDHFPNPPQTVHMLPETTSVTHAVGRRPSGFWIQNAQAPGSGQMCCRETACTQLAHGQKRCRCVCDNAPLAVRTQRSCPGWACTQHLDDPHLMPTHPPVLSGGALQRLRCRTASEHGARRCVHTPPVPR